MRAVLVFASLLLVSGVAVADKAKEHGKGKGKKKPVAEAPPAEEPAPPTPEPPYWASTPHVEGPKLVELGHQIELQLPEGYILFERAQAQELLRKGGNDVELVLGAVIKPGTDWSVIIEYIDVGYVTDSDADELKADELLASYRQGTEEQNRTKRKPLGVPDLFIDGWNELPRYDRVKRRLVWGLDTHDTDGKAVNYFTRILGRGGFISLNLIDAPETLAKSKVEAAVLIDSTRFQPGARYEDYREGDKSSGWGLTALVLGGAGIATAKAAKAGILITILIGLKKGIVFIAVGIAGFFKWLFGRKKTDPPPTT